MNLKNTVHSHFVLPLLRNAELKGVAPRVILQSANLPPEIMNEPLVRFTPNQYTAIIRSLWKELDDDFFGLSDTPVHFGTFALICELAMKEGRVGPGLEKQADCFKLATENVRWELSCRGDQAIFSLTVHTTDITTRNIHTELLLTMTHRFASWLAAERIPLTRVCFDFPKPDYVDEYNVMFDCPYLFDQPLSALEFPKTCLPWPIVRKPEELTPFLRQSPVGMLVHPQTEKNLIIKLRRVMLEGGGEELDFPSFEVIAKELVLSEGTLRRRLAEEETSYQKLKDDIRRDVAIDLLSDPTRSIFEIAYAVGFSAPSAFSRAFKGWTGLAPASFRELGKETISSRD